MLWRVWLQVLFYITELRQQLIGNIWSNTEYYNWYYTVTKKTNIHESPQQAGPQI